MRVSVFEPERFILLSAEVSSAEAVYEQMWFSLEDTSKKAESYY